MDSELQNINQAVHEDLKKENFENNKSRFEEIDYTHCFVTVDSNIIKIEDDNEKHLGNEYTHLQNISNLNQNMDSGLQNVQVNKLEKVPENKFENDKSHFKNADNAHCCETLGSNLQGIDNLCKNLDKGLQNIKEEVEFDQERLENSYLGNNAVIYIFENTHSNFQNNNNHVKQEIKGHQEQVSELTDKKYHKDVKLDIKFEDTELPTEKSDLSIDIDRHIVSSNLEDENSHLKNSNVGVENSYVKIGFGDLKPENKGPCMYKCNDNVARSDSNIEDSSSVIRNMDLIIVNSYIEVENSSVNIEFNDLKPESGAARSEQIEWKLVNSGSFNYSCSANDTRSDHFSIEESSSLMGNVDSEIECNVDNCDSKSENVDFNIENSWITDPLDSVNHRLENVVDLHPIALFKKLPDTFFNPGSQIYQINQTDLCPPEKRFSSIGDLHDNAFSDESQGAILGKLAEQVKINTDVRLHVCSLCKAKFQSRDLLSMHMIVHRIDKLNMCGKCDKKFKHSDLLRKHQLTPCNGRPRHLECHVCCKEFKISSVLNKHMITHSTMRPHQCSACDKKFKLVASLKRHMISHSSERPHQCDACDKTFKIAHQLKEHMIIHSTVRPHQCNVCDKGFKSSSGLRTHRIIHSSERPHQCNLCDKRFKFGHQLKEHLIRHSSERRHQCNICKRRFKTLHDMRKHIISHSTERPLHQCTVCDKGCKTANHLSIHMATHSLERPHTCSICDKTFKTNVALKLHSSIHNTDRPFRCDACGRSFKNISQLQKHLMTH